MEKPLNHLIRDNEIFVFGSNEAGIHGRGAALQARKYFGAKNGKGFGIQGNSFGIPTKDKKIKTLPLGKIRKYVNDFITFAKNNPDTLFFVTAIGTGLAGYKHEDIAPFFKEAPDNCRLPPQWVEILSIKKQYERKNN